MACGSIRPVDEKLRYSPMVDACNQGLALVRKCSVNGLRQDPDGLNIIFLRNDLHYLISKYEENLDPSKRKPNIVITSFTAAQRASGSPVLFADWSSMVKHAGQLPPGTGDTEPAEYPLQWMDILSCHEVKVREPVLPVTTSQNHNKPVEPIPPTPYSLDAPQLRSTPNSSKRQTPPNQC